MNVGIALLRGINVGTAKRVRMEDLKRVFATVGINDAQTYIQSGNVVFRGAFQANDELEFLLEAAIAREFGFSADFVVRSQSDLRAAIDKNPFPEAAKHEPGRLLVHFFKRAPEPGAEPRGIGQEAVKILGAEAYVYYPDGIAESKLKLPTVSTGRNWNTVLKLMEMADRFSSLGGA